MKQTKKKKKRARSARSVLVVLNDGACLWFPRAVVKRTGTTLHVRTADRIEIVVPAAGTDCVTHEAGAKPPEPIAQLEEAIDDIHVGLDERLWTTLEERRRHPRLVPFEDAVQRWGLKPMRRRRP